MGRLDVWHLSGSAGENAWRVCLLQYHRQRFLTYVTGVYGGIPERVTLRACAIGAKFFEVWMDDMERVYPGDDGVPPEVLIQMVTYLAALVLLYVICFLITGVIFAFAYQLVVDKQLTGWEAIKLSARAARENFGGVMGLLLLELALSTFGIMMCCFGLVLVMPLTKASWAIAYSHVFLPIPPPAPIPATAASTSFLWRRHSIGRISFRMNLRLLIFQRVNF